MTDVSWASFLWKASKVFYRLHHKGSRQHWNAVILARLQQLKGCGTRLVRRGQAGRRLWYTKGKFLDESQHDGVAEKSHSCNWEWISLHPSMMWSAEVHFPQLIPGLVPPAQTSAALEPVSVYQPLLLLLHLPQHYSWDLTSRDVTDLWCHCELRIFVGEGLGGPQPILSVSCWQRMVEAAGESIVKNPRKCGLWWGKKNWVPVPVS